MPRLSAIRINERGLDVEVGNAVIHVTYDITKITPAAQARFEEVMQNKPSEGVVLFLHESLRSWDLCDDKDRVLPITIDALRNVPIGILNAIVMAIAKDMQPESFRPQTTASVASE